MKRSRISIKTRENLLGYGFISLWIIGFFVFTFYPLVYSFYLSLNFVKIPTSGIELTYVGFANYKQAFVVDRIMILALWEFIKDSMLTLVIINVFAMIFALILNTNLKGKGIFRTLFFLPVVIVSGPVMAELLNQGAIVLPGIEHYEIINVFSAIFGRSFGEIIIGVFNDLIYMFWFSGVQIIVYLVILQKMNKEIYEASEIDGASPWEQFWKVTLPFLRPIILINMIYTLVLLAGFADNQVIIIIRNYMFNFNDDFAGFGFSAALVWIYFAALSLIVVFFFVIFTVRREKKVKISLDRTFYAFDMMRYDVKKDFYHTNPQVQMVKKRLLGRKGTDGILFRLFVYVLIIAVGFSFLYPFIYLGLKSIQSPQDILNSSIGLIPSEIYLDNYVKAFKTIGFWNALRESTTIALLPSLAQVFSTALIGYGLSRFNFKFKNIVIVLVLFTFIVPAPVLMIPTYLMYRDLGILGDVGVFVYPALFGQGIKSTIFIMIFYQFFNMIPKVLDEAALVDGAGPIQVFFRIALPLAVPSLIVVFLFSFVWYWNETYLTSLYIENARTLPIQLSRFAASFREQFGNVDTNSEDFVDELNEAIYMAGTLVSILPLLLLYFGLQRWFVEGVDRSGITGE